MTPEICPTCGAEVPPRALACPECGADETTGWSEKARYDDWGVPDDSFDYNEFIQNEFGEKAGGSGRRKPKRKRETLWLVVAVIVLLLFLFGFAL